MTLITTNRARIMAVVIALGVLALAGAWWREHVRAARLVEENERLRAAAPEAPAGARSEAIAAAPAAESVSALESPPETAALPDDAPVAESAAPAAPDTVLTPVGFARPPRDSGLALAGTHAAPIEGGIRATMQFNPSTTENLGAVALVVRVPPDGEGRILAFGPAGSVRFAQVAARISENGKFAVFQGTPESVAALEFTLSVSAPVVADVRGTTGIGAFDLVIDGSGAQARAK